MRVSLPLSSVPPVIAPLLWLAIATCANGQSLDTPMIGIMLDGNGAFRTVHGIAANFELGPELTEPPREDDEQLSSGRTVLRRGGNVFIADQEGGIHDALPRATGAVLLLPHAIVYIAGDELVLRRPDHSERNRYLPGITLLRRMSDDYVQAGSYALRISTGDLFLLPQPPSKGRRR